MHCSKVTRQKVYLTYLTKKVYINRYDNCCNTWNTKIRRKRNLQNMAALRNMIVVTYKDKLVVCHVKVTLTRHS